MVYHLNKFVSPYLKKILLKLNKQTRKANRRLTCALATKKSIGLKAFAEKYAKFVRINDEATANNKRESEERRRMREAINETKAKMKPKPYTASGPSHRANKAVFVVDSLTPNKLTEDAKKQTRKSASIEARREHEIRLKKARADEEERIIECLEKIRIGKEIGGN